MNTVLSCQSAAIFGGKWGSHSPQHSESLDGMQAIRYFLSPGALLEPKSMETASERRRRKLEDLCNKHGLEAVAEKAKVNPVALDQVIRKRLLPAKKSDGTRSPKGLGDKVAFAIEDAYGLGRGWFDMPDLESTGSIAFADLSPYEATLISALRDGLSVEELIQLIEAVKAAVRTKNARVIASGEDVTTSVYFGIDRRSGETPVKQNRRKIPWIVSTPDGSSQSPPQKAREGKK